MKKAQGRNTICTDARTALALCAALLATPAAADLPPPGCYARDYGAAHLVTHPAQGVAGLRLWYFSEDEAGTRPAVLVEARMAGQGQALRDGVAGQVLTQFALCDAQGACAVECDGGYFTSEITQRGGLRIATRHFTLGEGFSCGGSSDLAEAGAGVTTYRLAAAPAGECETLSRRYPLPAPGCYGVDYSDMGRGQGLLGLRLRLGPADEGFSFPQAAGTFRVRLPDGGLARQAGLGGSRIAVPVWCSSRDGLCRSGVDEGALAVAPLGQGLALSTRGFFVFGPEARSFDIAVPGMGETRHQLRLMPDDECRGMD